MCRSERRDKGKKLKEFLSSRVDSQCSGLGGGFKIDRGTEQEAAEDHGGVSGRILLRGMVRLQRCIQVRQGPRM